MQAEGAMVLPRKTIPGQRRPRFADGLHRPVGLVFASGHLLWTACQLSGKAHPSSPSLSFDYLCFTA